MNLRLLINRYHPSKLLCLRHAKLFYSQFGEDVILETLFDRNQKASYVDIGAYHPFRLSNTQRLYQAGWHGINIEPQPENHALFLKHRMRDINLNLAVGSVKGDAQLHLADTNTSLKNEDVLGRRIDDMGNSITVRVEPLVSILDEHRSSLSTLAFLSVDCEGNDLDVLQSNDWDRYRFAVVAVEDHESRPDSPIQSYMKDQGYVFVFRAGPTCFFKDVSRSPHD